MSETEEQYMLYESSESRAYVQREQMGRMDDSQASMEGSWGGSKKEKKGGGRFDN